MKPLGKCPLAADTATSRIAHPSMRAIFVICVALVACQCLINATPPLEKEMRLPGSRLRP